MNYSIMNEYNTIQYKLLRKGTDPLEKVYVLAKLKKKHSLTVLTFLITLWMVDC